MMFLIRAIKALAKFLAKLVWGIVLVILLFWGLINLYRAISAEIWILSEETEYAHAVGEVTKFEDISALNSCFLFSAPEWNPNWQCRNYMPLVTVSFVDEKGKEHHINNIFTGNPELWRQGSKTHVLYKNKALSSDDGKEEAALKTYLVPDIYSVWWHVVLWLKGSVPLLICFAPKLLKRRWAKRRLASPA